MRKSGFSAAMLLAVMLAAGPGVSEAQGESERKVEIEDAAGKAEQAVAAQRLRAAQLESERLLHEQEAEARRRAEEDRQAAARAKAIERDRSCVIRPVMSDAEIDRCKWAWSVPPPG